jgi:DNA polymerase-4/protein ImuB
MGVRVGMTVSQAIGLCPTLTLTEPDPVYYDAVFSRLLLDLERVSPVIEPAGLGRVFVGVQGLERLFGGPERQLALIARVTGRAEYLARAGAPETAVPPDVDRSWPRTVRLGRARGKFLAWVAASRAKPGAPVLVLEANRAAFLARQPVSVLPVSTEMRRRLVQLGLQTLADVARIPEPALVSQFGREGREAYQLAHDRIMEPVVGRERPQPIVVGVDFPLPSADGLVLAHALRKLIERALGHPRRTGWRVLGVRARALLEHGASWMTDVTLKHPSADAARIADPLIARLENTPPGGAVERLVVEFADFAPGTATLQLFARDANSAARADQREALHTAVREIKQRFKQSRLFHIVEVQPWSRLPERRYALIDFEP